MEDGGVAGGVQRPPEGMQLYLHPHWVVPQGPDVCPHSAFQPSCPCQFRSQHHPREKSLLFELKALSSLNLEIENTDIRLTR